MLPTHDLSDFSEESKRQRIDLFADRLRKEIHLSWDGMDFFRTSEFQQNMAAALLPKGDRLTSEFLATTWVYYTDMRDAFMRVIPDFCPHLVRIDVARFPPLEEVLAWMSESASGKIGYVSAYDGHMHYYFSDINDGFAFKLTFA